MANININSIDSLNTDVLELKNKVNNSLKNNIDNLNSILNSIPNYSNNNFNANIGDVSKRLKNNFSNSLNNITNASENIFDCISYINEFNVNDYDSSSLAIDLNDKYNNSYLIVNTNTNTDTDTNKDEETKDYTSNSNKDEINNNSNNNQSNQSNQDNQESINIPSSYIFIEKQKYSNNFDDNVLSIINNVTFDNNGLAKFEDRYVIEMSNEMGRVGDYVDILKSDGTTLNCIIGLTRENTDKSINFFVNQDIFISHTDLLKNIISIQNNGNYFNSVN